MKTFSPKPSDVERRWYVVDAQDAVLGRLATQVAAILRGKHKPIFAPHVDTGDHVIVVNAKGVRVTGGKESEKHLIRHSGFPGGLRTIPYSRVLAERPSTAVQRAVRGMLPKNRLGRAMLKKLVVYDGPEHRHQAQRPSALGAGELPRWEGLPAPKPKPAPKDRSRSATEAEKGKRGSTGRKADAARASAAGPGQPRAGARQKAATGSGERPKRQPRSRSKATATESAEQVGPEKPTRTPRRRRTKES